jgi:hypothetical protein
MNWVPMTLAPARMNATTAGARCPNRCKEIPIPSQASGGSGRGAGNVPSDDWRDQPHDDEGDSNVIKCRGD